MESTDLDVLWEDDNRRDPYQHFRLLCLQGRTVTARQAYQDYFRKQQRQRNSKHRGLKHDTMTDPDEVKDAALARVQAAEIEERLSDLEWECLVLTAAHDMTHEEAAKELGCSRENVSRAIARALAKLN